MSDVEQFTLIRSFLAAPYGCASAEEKIAWEAFFRTHDAMIKGVVRKYTSPWAELDDLIQEVRKALVRKLPGFQLDPARGPLRAWVLAVAHHAAAKEARRLSRDRADVLAPEVAATLVDPRPGPATLLERGLDRERREAVLAKIGAELSPLSHRILVMCLIDERTVPAIAAALGLSEACVFGRLHRARGKLRDRLRRAGFEPT